MTHFIGAVLVPAHVEFLTNSYPTKYPSLYGADAKEIVTGSALNEYLEKALDKFDENKTFDPFIEYTREQAIAKSREDVRKYAEEGLYAEYLKDPAAYAAKGVSPEHLNYVQVEFPKKLEWTDEQHYNDFKRWYEDEHIDADGNLYTTYNPNSKWDWWTVGGRWEKVYRERQGELTSVMLEELTTTLANMSDPEAQAELAQVEAEIEEVKKNFQEQRATYREVVAALPCRTHPEVEAIVANKIGETPLTWEDVDKAEARKLECRAYMPWWFPRNIVVPVFGTNADDEQEFREDGTPVETDYEWVTRGSEGWFGFASNDYSEADWINHLIHVLNQQDEGARLVYIDFHI